MMLKPDFLNALEASKRSGAMVVFVGSELSLGSERRAVEMARKANKTETVK